MLDKPFKFGLIGAGVIASEFIENTRVMPHVYIDGVYARTYLKTKSFAETNNINNVYSDVNKLLNSDIDAVYIATQNNTHYYYSMLALNANKHVFCEKPACVNYKQLHDILFLASDKKLKFMEAIRFLYTPAYVKLKNYLNDKIFGEVISIEGSLGRISNRTYRHTVDLCGGALLDLGVYPITAAIDILGVPVNIKSSCIKNKEGVDSTTFSLLSYPNKAVNITASFTTITRKELRVCCENGTITMLSPFTETNKLLLEDKVGNTSLVETATIATGMVDEIDHFIMNNSDNLNNSLSLEVVKVMDKIRQELAISFSCD